MYLSQSMELVVMETGGEKDGYRWLLVGKFLFLGSVIRALLFVRGLSVGPE